MKQFLRSSFRLPTLGLGLLCFAACSTLTVHVDVYRGPLANHEDVQLEQAIVMATASRPVLIEFRDRLEQKHRDAIGLKGDWRAHSWYCRGAIAAPDCVSQASEGFDTPCSCEIGGGRRDSGERSDDLEACDESLDRGEVRQAKCEACLGKHYLCSSQAMAINEILELFDEPRRASPELAILASRSRNYANAAREGWSTFVQGGGEEVVDLLLKAAKDATEHRDAIELLHALVDDRTDAGDVWTRKNAARDLLALVFESPELAKSVPLGLPGWSQLQVALLPRKEDEPASEDENEAVAQAQAELGEWSKAFAQWWRPSGDHEEEDAPNYRFRSTWAFERLSNPDICEPIVDFVLGCKGKPLNKQERKAVARAVQDVAAGFDQSRLTIDAMVDLSLEALGVILRVPDFSDNPEAQRAFGEVLDGALQLIDPERLTIALRLDGDRLLQDLRRISRGADYTQAVELLAPPPKGPGPTVGTLEAFRGKPLSREEWITLRRDIVEGVLYPRTVEAAPSGVCELGVDVCLTADAVASLMNLIADFGAHLSEGEVDFTQQQLTRDKARMADTPPEASKPGVSARVRVFSQASQGVAASSPLTRIEEGNASLNNAIGGKSAFTSTSGLEHVTRSTLRSSRVDRGLDTLITEFLRDRAAADLAPHAEKNLDLVAARREHLMRSLVRFSEKLRVHSVLTLAMGDNTLVTNADRQTAQLLEAVGQMLQFQIDELEHQVDAREGSVRRANAVWDSYQRAVDALYGTEPLDSVEPDPLGELAKYASDFDDPQALDLDDLLDTVQDAIVARKAELTMQASQCEQSDQRAELKSRVDALDGAIEVVAGHRRDQAFLRPAFAYLRQAYFASDLQAQVGANPTPQDRSQRELAELLDKRFWININRVHVRGYGKSGSALVKDDVGNWYVKGMSADPSEIFDTMKSAALLSLDAQVSAERAAEIAEVVTRSTPGEEDPGSNQKKDDDGDNGPPSPPTSRSGLVLDSVVDKADRDLEQVAQEVAQGVRAFDDDLPNRWSKVWSASGVMKDLDDDQVRAAFFSELASFLLRDFTATVPAKLEELAGSARKPGPTAPRRWIELGEEFLKEARGSIKAGENLDRDLLELRKADFTAVLDKWIVRVRTEALSKRRDEVVEAYEVLGKSIGAPSMSSSGVPALPDLPDLPKPFQSESGTAGRWLAASQAGEEAELLQLGDDDARKQWESFAKEAGELLELRGQGAEWLEHKEWKDWRASWGRFEVPEGGAKPDEALILALEGALRALDDAAGKAFGEAESSQFEALAEAAQNSAELLHGLHSVLAPNGGKPNTKLADLDDALRKADAGLLAPLAAKAIAGLEAYRERLNFGMELVEEPPTAAAP